MNVTTLLLVSAQLLINANSDNDKLSLHTVLQPFCRQNMDADQRFADSPYILIGKMSRELLLFPIPSFTLSLAPGTCFWYHMFGKRPSFD